MTKQLILNKTPQNRGVYWDWGLAGPNIARQSDMMYKKDTALNMEAFGERIDSGHGG